jgi:hypothetical protein
MPSLAVLLLLRALASSVHAHTDEYFDQRPTPHGGQVRMAGPIHLELVVAHQQVTVYVTDHGDNLVPTAKGSAKVIIRSGKRNRYVLVLRPAGENVLRGTGEFKLGKSNDVSVLVALPEHEPQRAQFRIGPDGNPMSTRKNRKGHGDH